MNSEILQNIYKRTWSDVHFCVIYIYFIVYIYYYPSIRPTYDFPEVRPNISTILVHELTINLNN